MINIVYITCRKDCRFEWFLESLKPQVKSPDEVRIITVDRYAGQRALLKPDFCESLWITPKPDVWQGRFRLTKEDWWAISTARNTGICLSLDGWVAFCDDRSAVSPQWLECIREAMRGNYAVAGSYEKVFNMRLVDGIVQPYERAKERQDVRVGNPYAPVPAPGSWYFGCTSALPVEWALEINGFDETCNGCGLEDTLFGQMLVNRGYPLMYDMRMKLFEDRTPEIINQEKMPCRQDVGVSPDDKSHALVDKLIKLKRSCHQWDLRSVRKQVLAGNGWPIPKGPTHCWYTKIPLSELVP